MCLWFAAGSGVAWEGSSEPAHAAWVLLVALAAVTSVILALLTITAERLAYWEAGLAAHRCPHQVMPDSVDTEKGAGPGA